MTNEPLVDYRRAAARYDQGRALADRQLEGWRAAAAEALPAGIAGARVLDVGSGTGIFSVAWRAWGAAAVIAVEPSPEMRAKAASKAATPAGAGIHLVAGGAEQLPFRSGAFDAVWLSAVVHHIGDLPRAARELRRVIRTEGRVLVRGLFPDHSTIAWLDHFPGAERSRARFPTTAALAEVFAGADLEVAGVAAVPEQHRGTNAEAAEWVTLMRSADTLLTALTDDEIAAGVESLRRDPTRRLHSNALTLLTFRPTSAR